MAAFRRPKRRLPGDDATRAGNRRSSSGRRRRSRSPPVVVPRWVQMVLLPLGLLGLWALARAAGTVLLILVVAGLIALMLNPLVKLFERVMPRGLAILVLYLGGFASLGAIGVALSSPVSTQVTRFSDDVPHLVKQANHASPSSRAS